MKVADQLPPKRSREYKHARGYTRYALSSLLGLDPLKVPLISMPGQAPKLEKGWGYISFSHCTDALLVGWSTKKLGVDIERMDRKISDKQIAERYFTKQEKESFKKLDDSKLPSEVLKNWVVKEAAIKWQRGKLLNDLSQWHWFKDKHLAIHQRLNYRVNIFQEQYSYWQIAVAFTQNDYCNYPIICSKQ